MGLNPQLATAPDVAVVGGGAIGGAVAYYLAKAGAKVAIFERELIGSQASGAAAGMLTPLSEGRGPGPLLELALAGLRLFPALAQELQQATGIDVEYRPTGLLRPAMTEAEAQELRSRWAWLEELELQWLSWAEARALEPALSPRVRGALYSPQEGQVNAGKLALALAQGAAGAELRQGEPVLGLTTQGRRIRGLRTTQGRVAAGHVVLAAGAWLAPLARRMGLPALPVRPVRGQMLALGGMSPPIRHTVWGSAGYLVPKANGLIFAGATVEEVGFRSRTTARGIARLRRMARTLVPSLAYAQVASAWAGLRPASADGLPILGPLPGWEGLSVAGGHFRQGILLAPITGRLLAQLLTRGQTELPLEPFSPARFGL